MADDGTRASSDDAAKHCAAFSRRTAGGGKERKPEGCNDKDKKFLDFHCWNVLDEVSPNRRVEPVIYSGQCVFSPPVCTGSL
jgi:hypothetical protein